MSAGIANRHLHFGTWRDRFIDWFRDLDFLQKSGVETKAARDIAAFVNQPPRSERRGGNGPSGTGAEAWLLFMPDEYAGEMELTRR